MFGDGNYVAVTGWPDMQMTISGDGWLGIAPSTKAITLRSLDFWRCENGLFATGSSSTCCICITNWLRVPLNAS